MATPYLTAAQCRVGTGLDDTSVYTDAAITDLVAEFEDLAERYRGAAFTPRTATETIQIDQLNYWATGSTGYATSGNYSIGNSWVRLDHCPVRSISVFTLGGVAIPAGYTLNKSTGYITNLSLGVGTLVVTYDHGFDAPSTLLLRACKLYVRACCKSDASGTSRDVLSQNIDGATTRYSTPDWGRGRPTGFLEVDRLLNSITDYRVPASG